MVAVNTGANEIYVAYEYDSDAFEIIDGATDNVISNYGLPNTYIVGMGVNTATDKIYLVMWGSSLVEVVSASGHIYQTEIPAVYSDERGGIAVNTVTNKIYVPDVGASGVVAVIAGSSDTLLVNIPAGGNGPIGAAVNTATNRVYVTNQNDNTLTVIDGATNTIVNTVPVGTSPYFIGVLE